ncbi:MAG: heat-inducible transcriptional repressor [Thermoleophilaceae bacterium]|nr:heat-inducible transcriptional repressor [Thermoleophilaceae bacterium]
MHGSLPASFAGSLFAAPGARGFGIDHLALRRARGRPRHNRGVEITDRQSFVLRKVVEVHRDTGQPVGSKWLADQADVPWGPSTVRAELARLEELGLLQHPHTSAGRVPTDRGYRHYVDELLEDGGTALARPPMQIGAVRQEVDHAMQATTEQLSQVTNLLAIVSAPPLGTTTIKHVEVLLLQPQVAMVVVITSTGGVTKRVVSYEVPVDPGLVNWARSYLNEVLGGLAVGARMVYKKLTAPDLSDAEQSFLVTLAPAFMELEDTAEDTLYVGGATRLMSEHRLQELSQINDLLQLLERRVALLGILRSALEEPSVYLRIGTENEQPELRSLSVVAANYGIATRNLGAVSVLGPVRMDYPRAIASVRQAALELSHFVSELYDE